MRAMREGEGTMGDGTTRGWEDETMRKWDDETMRTWDDGNMGTWEHGTMRTWDDETMRKKLPLSHCPIVPLSKKMPSMGLPIDGIFC